MHRRGTSWLILAVLVAVPVRMVTLRVLARRILPVLPITVPEVVVMAMVVPVGRILRRIHMGRELTAASHAELGVDVAEVVADGAYRQVQSRGDGGAGQPG